MITYLKTRLFNEHTVNTICIHNYCIHTLQIHSTLDNITITIQILKHMFIQILVAR